MSRPEERLKESRSRLFVSASAAAKAHGWTVSTYLCHENGSRQIGWQTAQRYARAFRVDPAWLLAGKGDPQGEPSPPDEVSEAIARVLGVSSPASAEELLQAVKRLQAVLARIADALAQLASERVAAAAKAAARRPGPSPK